jgi:hypothetical protein
MHDTYTLVVGAQCIAPLPGYLFHQKSEMVSGLIISFRTLWKQFKIQKLKHQAYTYFSHARLLNISLTILHMQLGLRISRPLYSSTISWIKPSKYPFIISRVFVFIAFMVDIIQ